MNLPAPDDYIDIHNHGGIPKRGYFCIENLMAHERGLPGSDRGISYTYGIHPWHLTKESAEELMDRVRVSSGHPNVVAIGECGYDKLRGPDQELQMQAFEEQAAIAGERSLPLFIHCVRAWDELLASHKKIRPAKPWLVHGFRGKKELAMQLISKGMYISFWFEFILRLESSDLVRSLPADRIFLETDGSGTDIGLIYKKVAADLDLDVTKLKEQIFSNYFTFFDFKP
jgi:TatD DNase family protein